MARFGLRAKLLIGSLILGTLPLIVASVILPLQVESTLTQQGHDHLTQVAKDLATLTQNELERNMETVRSLASMDLIAVAIRKRNAGSLEAGEVAALNRQLAVVLRQLAAQDQGIFLAGADGLVFSGVVKSGETAPYVGMDLRDRAYFEQARETLRPVISDPIKSKIGGVPIVAIVVPIVDPDIGFAGLLGLSIEIEYLATLISSQKLGKTGYPFAVDRQGAILAHPDRRRIFAVNLSRIPGAEHLAGRMVRGETGVEAYVSSTGARKLAAFAPVAASGWSIAASIETAEFGASAQRIRRVIFVMIGACIVIAVLVGITFAVGMEKLRSALAETRRSEAELAVIHHHAPTMMLVMDRANQVRRANRAADVFAARTGDLTEPGREGDFLRCVHALDDARGCGFGPACSGCAQHNAVLDTLATGTDHSRIETRLRVVRGSATDEVVLLSSTAAIPFEGSRGVLLCLEDITEQRRAEEQIREQAALLNVTQDAVCVLDLDETVMFWNRGAERIYGRSATETLGCKLDDGFGEVLDRRTYEVIKDAVWTQGEWSGEVRMINRAGRMRTLQCRAALVRDAAGDPRSILVVNTDVTETKELESQFLRAQRLESLGELAGGVAHDLNNVLAPILMAIELLRPLAVEPADRNTIEVLRDSAKRGAEVVRQLLLFGRGSDEPPAKVDLRSVIAELRRITQASFPKEIEITYEVPEDLDAVMANATQVHQVLLNLFVNARDAMPNGGHLSLCAANADLGEAFAAAQPGAKCGPYVRLKVSDTGTGISPAVLEKIFDPFFTTKPKGRGTGLGLSTVVGIVRGHGGFVTVESQVGEGTTFSVYLPAVHAAASGVQPEPAAIGAKGFGEQVLVVDDEPAIRDVLRRNLEAANYRVLLAQDGAEALSLFQRADSAVRVVIVDLIMPVLNGIEMIRDLRQIDKGVPIIVLSGSDAWEARFRESELLAVSFLPKPFATAELLSAVRHALDSRRLPTHKTGAKV